MNGRTFRKASNQPLLDSSLVEVEELPGFSFTHVSTLGPSIFCVLESFSYDIIKREALEAE